MSEVAEHVATPVPSDDELRIGVVIMAQQVQWLCEQVSMLMSAASRSPLIASQMRKKP